MFDSHHSITTVYRMVDDDIIKIVDIPIKVNVFAAKGEWILCDTEIFRIDLD